MKNPFIKENNSGTWIAVLAITTFAATAATYYYFINKNAEAKARAAEAKEHALDYLQAKAPKKKKHKTDLHELEDIVTHQQHN